MAYIDRTQTAGSRTTATFSAWVKRGTLGTEHVFFENFTDATNFTRFRFNSDGTMNMVDRVSGVDLWYRTFSRYFLDPGAWYHIVVTIDSTEGAAGDRIKIYINGVAETEFSASQNPGASATLNMNKSGSTWRLGSNNGNSSPTDAVMSHVHWIDGTAYQAATFGETDATSGIWTIQTSPSVTYGTNGLFLKMEDRTNLDLDSGTNTFTMTTTGDLTATYDNPDNNFCTWTPLWNRVTNSSTFTNANTTVKNTNANWGSLGGTLSAKSGKWYFEAIGGNTTGPGYMHYGFCSTEYFAMGGGSAGTQGEPGTTINFPSYTYYGYNGNAYYNTTTSNGQTSAYGATYANTDYIGVFLDLDNSKIYWSKNGTIQNSGTGITIDNANSDSWTPITGTYTDATGHETNFGNGVFGTTTLGGTTYQDENGQGMFKYSPNDGGASSFDGSAKDFYALCTKNIKLYGG